MGGSHDPHRAEVRGEVLPGKGRAAGPGPQGERGGEDRAGRNQRCGQVHGAPYPRRHGGGRPGRGRSPPGPGRGPFVPVRRGRAAHPAGYRAPRGRRSSWSSRESWTRAGSNLARQRWHRTCAGCSVCSCARSASCAASRNWADPASRARLAVILGPSVSVMRSSGR
jgi:hypothetical protein